MKYVMFLHPKAGILTPGFASDSIPHCDIKVGPGWVPVSAGYFSAKSGATGHSESMGLKSRPGDTVLCSLVVLGLESMSMMHQNIDENKKLLKSLRPQRQRPGPTKP